MSVANLKKRAKRLLKEARADVEPSIWRFKRFHPKYTDHAPGEIGDRVALSDAQLVIAREWGFRTWPDLLDSYELLEKAPMNTRISAEEVIPFIPSKDFQASIDFYSELFETNWQTESLCQVQAGRSRFLIQDFYDPDYVKNCMYQLMVQDVETIWTQFRESGVLNRHGNVRANPPKKEAWGTVVYLWGPAGELWHITQPLEPA